jgi:hypothetical protein
MRNPVRNLSLLAAMVAVAVLMAGCGSAISSASSAINSLTSRSATPSTGPTTAPPTTAPPTTAPPTTVAPTTVAPTTVAPTTAAPTSAPPTSASAASASASATPGTGTGTKYLWLWILLAVVVVVIGLIVWITHATRRRSAAAASSRSRLIDAYAKGSALHDAMSVAEAPGSFAAADSGARWADIQRRADDLTQTLYALRESVPDLDQQGRIADVLASLQAVRSAMDAERAPGGAGPQQAEVVRGRLYSFEMALRALRTSDQEYT